MRQIKTTFFKGVEPIHVNSSCDSNRAVAQCILHMQVNRYGATAAEVYDNETGELHAQIRRYVDSSIKITYQRNPQKYETRLASTPFLRDLGILLAQKGAR